MCWKKRWATTWAGRSTATADVARPLSSMKQTGGPDRPTDGQPHRARQCMATLDGAVGRFAGTVRGACVADAHRPRQTPCEKGRRALVDGHRVRKQRRETGKAVSRPPSVAALSAALRRTSPSHGRCCPNCTRGDVLGTSSTSFKAAFTTMLAAGTDSFCFDTQRQTPTAITENDDGYLLGELRREEHLHAGFQGRAAIDDHPYQDLIQSW